MNSIMFYSSAGGNTRKVADAIATQLTNCKVVDISTCDMAEVQAEKLADFDRIYIGYWVFQGDCDTRTTQLATYITDQAVVLFGTLGAAENTRYYEVVKKNVETHFPLAKILGHNLCQGAIGEATVTRYRQMVKAKPDDEHLRAQLENYEQGRTHPDADDLQHARQFATSIE